MRTGDAVQSGVGSARRTGRSEAFPIGWVWRCEVPLPALIGCSAHRRDAAGSEDGGACPAERGVRDGQRQKAGGGGGGCLATLGGYGLAEAGV